MKSNILRQYHPMIGCDFHIPHPPPIGNPLWPPMPYFVFNLMKNMLFIELTTLYTPDVKADAMQSNMCRTTDIGMLTPHIGVPSLTIVIEMIFGGSKSYFGPLSVDVKDQYKSDKNPASALGVVVNPNLNCGFPFPTPFGIVFAFNTTQCDLTLGDILGGLYEMLLDFVFQTLINLASHFLLGRLLSYLGPKLASKFVKPLSRAASRRAARDAWKAAGKSGPLSAFARDAAQRPLERFALAFETFFGAKGGFLFGSPLGTDLGAPGIRNEKGGKDAGKGVPTPYTWGRELTDQNPEPESGEEPKTWGLPTAKQVGAYFDQPAPQPVPSPPGPAPTPTATPAPQGAVNNYLTDPSVEHIGGP